MFEYFITHARTDRYNLMCYLVSHDKIQPAYEDDESSIGDRSIPKNSTTKSLKALGDTLNFIDIWQKLFVENYDAICDAYINSMKKMSNKIPQTMPKVITPKQKVHKRMTGIGGIPLSLFSIYHPPPISVISFWNFCFGVGALIIF